MTERNIAAEVLRGLREVRDHRAGKSAPLRQTRVEPTPISALTPEMVERIREDFDGSQDAASQLLRTPVNPSANTRQQPRERDVRHRRTDDAVEGT